MGAMAREGGDLARARVAFEEAVALHRARGDRHRLADSVSNLALMAVDEDRLDEAATLFAESIALDRGFDNHGRVAQNLSAGGRTPDPSPGVRASSFRGVS